MQLAVQMWILLQSLLINYMASDQCRDSHFCQCSIHHFRQLGLLDACLIPLSVSEQVCHFSYYIWEKAGIFTGSISNTWQPTPKQSRLINSMRGKRKNMWLWFGGELSLQRSANWTLTSQKSLRSKVAPEAECGATDGISPQFGNSS